MQSMETTSFQDVSIRSFDNKEFIRVIAGFALVIAGVIAPPIMYAAAIYGVAMLLLCRDEDTILSALFSWLSISPIFKFSPNATSIFTYLEIISIVKLFIINRKIEKQLFGVLSLYMVYVLIGSKLDGTTYIKTIVLPIIVYLTVRNMDYARLSKISGYYILGVFIGSLIGVCRAWIPNINSFIAYKSVNLSYSAGTGYESAIRFSGLWGDPNYYSIHLLLVMAICILFYIRKQIKIISFSCLFGGAIVFGAMTGSKSFILMAAIVTFFFIISLIYNRQFSRMIIVLSIIIITLLLMYTGKIDIFSTVLTRFTNVSTGFARSGLTTGRTELLPYYLHLFIEDPIKLLVGNGIGIGHSYRPPHNTLIDFLDIVGVFGTALFGAVIVRIYKLTPSDGYGSIFILLIVPMFFFLSMFYSIDFCFELALILCFLRMGSVPERI